jgi:glutaredoxin
MRKSLEQLRKQLLNEVAADNQSITRAFMFITNGCPYCDRASRILGANRIEVHTINVDAVDPRYKKNYDIFEKFFPQGEFKPRIWLALASTRENMPSSVKDPNWEYIGGCDDLIAHCYKHGLTVVR